MFGTYGREAKGELVVIVVILISMQCARIKVMNARFFKFQVITLLSCYHIGAKLVDGILTVLGNFVKVG